MVWYGWLVLTVTVAVGFTLVSGMRRVASLARLPDPPPDWQGPLVSVVVAARNEARAIESTIRSILGQSYSRMELIVVNDRSEDATGEILERLTRRESDLSVVTIETLP